MLLAIVGTLLASPGMPPLGALIWGNLGIAKAFALLDGGTNVTVFTDCRFRNEVLAIKRAGGKVYRIKRPNPSKTAKSKHASEAEQSSIPDFWCDGVLHNNDSKKEFEAQVLELADGLGQPRYETWSIWPGSPGYVK